MIVAVPVVRVVHMAVHQVVQMVTVRHDRMTTSGPVDVVRIMARTAVRGRTSLRIRDRHRHTMFVDVVAVRGVHVAVVQVIHVIAVLNCDVAAVGSVNMIVMVVVRLRAVHRGVPFFVVGESGRAYGIGVRCSPAWSIALATRSSTC